jgi:integrase
MKEKQQHQRGYIWRVGKSWFARWYREEYETDAGGERQIVRKQHAEKLCEYGDRYRAKRDVQPLLDAKLLTANEGRDRPESTLSVAAYGEDHFLPYAEKELKASTAHGYKNIFRIYLKPRLTNIALRDFRCVDATNLLAALHQERALSKKSLRHCKSLLGSIFTFAKRSGVIDGMNPIADAGIPRGAEASKGTHAYTPEEMLAMLDSFEGIAKTAIALLYFCGLRPGEARAARWEDYDSKTLEVRASMWRTHLTTTKTLESVGQVPISEKLRDILAESRRESGFILAGPSGRPVNLANLARRTIRPALARCAKCHQEKKEHDDLDHEFKKLPEWRGFYACRRGLATLATSIDSKLAAKSLLRHSNIATTEQFYIKSVDKDAVRAMATIDAVFQKSADALPN